MTKPQGNNVDSCSSSHLEKSSISHTRHDSKVSVGTNHSTQSQPTQHQEYISNLMPPSQKSMDRIAAVQERKEEEIMMKRVSQDGNGMDDVERSKAAGLIQRNYRGYRERRQLQGLGLDPSTRWVEAIKEARYRNLTTPRARADTDESGGGPEHNRAREQWKKIGTIVRRAGGDEEGESDSSEESGHVGLSEDQKKEKRRQKMEQKAARQKAAKLMDLQYFLEMVDVRHRYGSNLRTYHQEWKKADTNENFFYWLDYGEGRFIDCAGCPRERLDRECVRYLSKEERLNYLVKIDNEGRLCWAKNGVRIDTTEQYKDSIHGIVPADDPTPAYNASNPAAEPTDPATTTNPTGNPPSSPSSTDTSHRDSHEEPDDAAGKYTNDKFQSTQGIKKVKHVSAATIFNKLLRSSVKKNTWIFVADTSFRLYVGIKQSGAFQHSSFLHGSRISAAGLIKIKNGRLSKLSPLSGHYRPPVSNFRSFVHSLQERGVDMSHVSISRSYAVLVGLEAYVKTRRKGKRVMRHLIHRRDKLLDPEETRRREEEERDKSESARLERRFLEKEAERQRRREDEERDANVVAAKLIEKLRIGTRVPRIGGGRHNGGGGEDEVDEDNNVENSIEPMMDTNHLTHAGEMKEISDGLRSPGPGPEAGIAPEGKRKEVTS